MPADVQGRRPVSVRLKSVRVRALQLWNEGHDHVSIGALLGVSRRTACRYVHSERASQPHFEQKDRHLERRALNDYFLLPSHVPQTVDLIARYSPMPFRALLEALTATQQRTFNLYFRQLMTLAQVADLENVSLAAVSRRVERIQRKFVEAALPYPVRLEPYRRRIRMVISSRLMDYALGETVWE
jgi:predicted DNA-binding protein YlxM (UPF0122 family)